MASGGSLPLPSPFPNLLLSHEGRHSRRSVSVMVGGLQGEQVSGRSKLKEHQSVKADSVMKEGERRIMALTCTSK